MRRRTILKNLAAGALIVPVWRNSWAAKLPASFSTPRLIVVLLRGGVDGLSVVVPYSDPAYYYARPSISIPRPGQPGGALLLDHRFGLHPALEALMPLWRSGRLAFVHSAGSPDPTRSHFDAQFYMESGIPGMRATRDGWMNRLLGALPGPLSPTFAVSVNPTLPQILRGEIDVVNIPRPEDFPGSNPLANPDKAFWFDRLYATGGELASSYRKGRDLGRRIAEVLDREISGEIAAAAGAPSSAGFAVDAIRIAQLMRGSTGAHIGFIGVGGWDTHAKQGASSGALAKRLANLGEGLATLARELGQSLDNTVIVVMSEFGRTVHENGSGGTDHGHGNVMWVLGGPVHGGAIYGDWPTLASLHEGRDLQVTTDFRSVLSTICSQHLRLNDVQMDRVFPNAPSIERGLGQLIRT